MIDAVEETAGVREELQSSHSATTEKLRANDKRRKRIGMKTRSRAKVITQRALDYVAEKILTTEDRMLSKKQRRKLSIRHAKRRRPRVFKKFPVKSKSPSFH